MELHTIGITQACSFQNSSELMLKRKCLGARHPEQQPLHVGRRSGTGIYCLFGYSPCGRYGAKDNLTTSMTAPTSTDCGRRRVSG